MRGIFISYRREDTAGYAGRLYDRLASHFGPQRVFMDVEGIEPGVDFVDAIEQAVASCEALIVLIGDSWLAANDAGKRRLDDPADFVRIETGAALARGIRVVPVLVEGATMPRATDLPPELASLARRQAVEIGHKHWEAGCDELIRTLEKVLTAGRGSGAATAASDAGTRRTQESTPDRSKVAAGTRPTATEPAGTEVAGPAAAGAAGDGVAGAGVAGAGVTSPVPDRTWAYWVIGGVAALVIALGSYYFAKAPRPSQVVADTRPPAVAPQPSVPKPELPAVKLEPPPAKSEPPPAKREPPAAKLEPPAAKLEPPTPPRAEATVSAPKLDAPVASAPAIKSARPPAPAKSAVAPKTSPPAPSSAASAPASPPSAASRTATPSPAAPPAASIPAAPAAAAPAGTPVPTPHAATAAAAAAAAAAAVSPALPRVGDLWEYRFRAVWKTIEPRTYTHQVTAVSEREIRESMRADPGAELPVQSKSFAPETGFVEWHGKGHYYVEFNPYLAAFGAVPAPGTTWKRLAMPAADPSLGNWNSQGRVADWGSVSVPAGTFRALRIEITGTRAPTGPVSMRATEPTRVVHVVWYAPDVKRTVKAVRTVHSTTLARLDEDTWELVKYRVQ